MCDKSCVSWTIFELFKLRLVSQYFLDLMNSSFYQTTHSTLEFSYSDGDWFPTIILKLHPISHSILVTILKISILDSDGMNHGVTIEPMLTAV